MIKPAAYYHRVDNSTVICDLCPADCRLAEGKTGICGSRFNQAGELFTDNYAELVTLAMDPIEKKPLYHFYPGSEILSTGPNCCNLGCLNCQNWSISQGKASTIQFNPERLVQAALDHQSIGVAFTYSEPMLWFEYIMDVAPILHHNGLKVVMVTNGYINADPLADLLKVTDAMNVDLKGMSEDFYKRICKGRLQPVLENVRQIALSGVHLELTNLIIPGENDSDRQIAELVDFVASLGETIPLHFSAYHPDYQMENPSTPEATLLRARQMAVEKLRYVYIGNAVIPGGSDTRCPQCNALLVSRSGYRAEITGLQDGRCTACGTTVGIRQ